MPPVDPAGRRPLRDSELPPTIADASHTSSLRPPPIGPTAPLAALSVGDVIAEGGMGVVRAAVQRSLGRSVVIKTALPRASEGDARRMLLEAWVTGYLEHPGIVPVYDIVKGDDGSPVVVMRRIRGRTWHSCIRDEAWAEAEGARDLLEQNLRVFIRVCEILEFAHSKHIVHRDVKPSNVMVGSFGEVYLLDWGLAVATGGEAAQHLPNAKVAEDVCGTFSYAAPEMVGLLEVPVSLRTDVYLLGSVLFELATGAPPHRAGDTRLTLESIAATPPVIPAGVSRQLGVILRRALQRYPEDRYPSVGELRRDVLAFLRQRDSEHVALEAEGTLAELQQACAAGGGRQRVYDLYGVCRFAFREALRTWPENAPARAGLAAAARTIVEHELARDPRVARALLADASVPMPDLEARVTEAIAAEEQHRAELSKVARDHDSNVGRRARRVFLLFMAFWWCAGQVFGDRLVPPSYPRFITGSLVQLPLIGLAWAISPELRATLFNRRMLGAVAVTIVSQLALFAGGAALHVDLPITRLAQVGLWALVSTMVAVVFERRFWPSALTFAAATVVVTAAPDLRPWASSVGIAVLTINFIVIKSTNA